MRAKDRRGGEGEIGRALSNRGAGTFSLSLEDRICYSFDATDIRSLPAAVAWPTRTAEVAAAVLAAADCGVPVVPRGAGTGYTGGSVPLAGGVVISLERMNRVLLLDPRRRLAVVEPGVVNETLRARAGALGLTYPPDPASLLVSTIGGNVAEGAGGPRTVLYGATGAYIVGLEFVLHDGTVASTGLLRTRTQSVWDAGPALVGSEGTLAVVTRVALRLTELPEARATFWIEFAALERAAKAVAAITASGLPVSVLEIMDRETLRCSLEYVRGGPVPDSPESALLVEVEGASASVAGAGERLRALSTERGATVFREATEAADRDALWEARRAISPSLARFGVGKLNEDIAVPRSAIPSFVRALESIGREADLPILSFGHAGDGNLHVNVMVDRSDRDAMRSARRAIGRIFEAARALDGTLSGEHGIGITKAEHLTIELDETAVAANRAVKRALDPRGSFNPEKILTARANPWWAGLAAPGGDAGEAPDAH